MELGLETLEERRQKQDMALVYKMTQDAQMTSMFKKARSNNQGARTRQATAHQGRGLYIGKYPPPGGGGINMA